MIRLLALGAGLSVSVVLAGVALFGSQGEPLEAGDAAPDFTLKASDGQTYHLGDLKGTTVVLAWFPKAFTGG